MIKLLLVSILCFRGTIGGIIFKSSLSNLEHNKPSSGEESKREEDFIFYLKLFEAAKKEIEKIKESPQVINHLLELHQLHPVQKIFLPDTFVSPKKEVTFNEYGNIDTILILPADLPWKYILEPKEKMEISNDSIFLELGDEMLSAMMGGRAFFRRNLFPNRFG